MPDWDKDIYWHFFIGDQHFRLPKPFEIGLMFATLPERMIRAIGGKESGKKFAKLVAHNFMEQLAFNPIPQIALPLAENLVNYDFLAEIPLRGWRTPICSLAPAMISVPVCWPVRPVSSLAGHRRRLTT
ncbi:hypothetical protein OUA51_17990 [Edwardsiella ictaluri]|uniref:LPD38 domain-containing protein n=1 Tax=Edwardsiella ictaluri TaxID=67780 RepID=UPI003782FAE5